MKLNIQVELDWIEEDGNLDKEVQEQIITGVKNAISRDCLKMVEKKTQAAIDNGMESAIELMKEKVSNFFEEWLNNEVKITDNYGDTIKHGSLNDIIKQEFNNCMNERVGKDGKVTSYGSNYSRLEFVTGKKVTEVVNDYMANYGKDIDKTIKKAIEEGIKSRVSDKFAEMVIGYAKQDYENSKAIEHKSQ
jgi:hypothetical protein